MNVLTQMLWWLPVSNDTCFSEHLKRSPRHSGCRSPHFWSTRTLYAASSANCCSSSQIQLRHAGAIVPNAANWTSMGCHLGMNQHPCDHRMKPVPGCQVPYPLTCKLSKEQNERHRGQQSSNLVNSLIYTSFADRSYLGRFRTNCQETCAHTWKTVFHWFESVYSVQDSTSHPDRPSHPVPWRAGKWWAVVTRVAFWCALDKGLPVLLGDS